MTTTNAETWVGPYALLGQLGEGGMARAFLARRRGSSGLVVVKMRKTVVDEELDASIAQRFAREGQVNVFIRNRNVAELLDAALDADPPYLVFELVTGAPLGILAAPFLREGRPVPPPIVGRIIKGVLAGLHHLHEARDESGERLFAVHRDVTPGNVMINLDGVPKIIDLGLVRAEAGGFRTQLGQVLGTAQYIPPETASGEAAWVDRTADLYSVGVVAYELLTGAYVFPPGTRVAEVAERLAKPIFAPLVERAPAVPPALAAVIERALRIEPAERWSSAHEMSREVGAALGEDIASEAEVAALFEPQLGRARQQRDLWQAQADAERAREMAGEGADAVFEPTKTGMGPPKDGATLVVRTRTSDAPNPEIAMATSELLAASRPTVVLRRGVEPVARPGPVPWPTVVVAVLGLALIAATWVWAMQEREPVVVVLDDRAVVVVAEPGPVSATPQPIVTDPSSVTPEPRPAPARRSEPARTSAPSRPRVSAAPVGQADPRLRAMELLYTNARREAGVGTALDRYLSEARRLIREAGTADAAGFEKDLDRLEGAAAARDEPAVAKALELLHGRVRSRLGVDSDS